MSVVVVGSGASAVHFALTVLEKGGEVLMLDVGRERPDAVRPTDDFEQLKSGLEDPAAHFLGEDFEAVVYPGEPGEYYGFPPNKNYVFEGVEGVRVRPTGFAPLLSFARGGLAEAWTAGVFPFADGELADFPFGLEELGPYYDLVAGRIGISGAVDDLAEHMPVHRHLMEPLDLDEHSRLLLERYERRREKVRRSGAVVGRSRVATLSRDREDRPGCGYLGRCLMGCPQESLYTPVVTLRECLLHERFTYRPGVCVRWFEAEGDRVTAVVVDRIRDGRRERVPVESLALGAGTLASGAIFLESWRRSRREVIRLTGLMDNRQVLCPFVNPALIGRAHDPRTYQYHQVLIGLTAADPRDYVHGIVTTLKAAQIHPIVQGVPLDVRTSLRIFRNLHCALGLVNVNFADRRRSSCYLTLDGGAGDENPGPLRVHYEPPAGERARIARALRRLRGVLLRLGCLPAPGMSHVRPMGASVHYAGTLPMTEEEEPQTTTREGQSRDFQNLWLVDGSTFPFLPAKNLTFTLMANAARIADRAF